MDDWMKSFYDKIKSNEALSENELRDLAYEGGDYHEISESRWEKQMVTVLEFDSEIYLLFWEKGLTEYQEDIFDKQPQPAKINSRIEVVKIEHVEYLDDQGKVLFKTKKEVK